MSIVNPSRGIQLPNDQPVRVMNRSGSTLVIGSTVRFDDCVSPDATTTSYEYGDDDSAYYNVVAPSTAGLHNAFYGIVTNLLTGGGVDNAEVMVKCRGRVDALVEGTDATAIGEPLFAKNANHELNSDNVTGGRVLGRAIEATAAGTAELVPVYFNGIEGLGVSV